MVLAACLAAFVVTSAAGVTFYDLKRRAFEAKESVAANLKEVAAAFQSFDIAKARAPLRAIKTELEALRAEASAIGAFELFALGGKLFPVLKDIPGALDDFLAFSGTALQVSEELAVLERDAFGMMFTGRGPELLERLGRIDGEVTHMLGLASRLQSSAAALRWQFPGEYLSLMVKLYRHQALLQGLRGFLGDAKPAYLALLFQNPSEMRPTGGFIGSYAVLTVQNGNVTDIDVRDIYDPDGQLDKAVLPPRPLQAITGRWGARDANWFFNFPTSAAKALSFLEQSKIYSEQHVTFGAGVAVNATVIADVLSVTGPIELPEYHKTVTGDNFLATVQEEVESGADKRAGTPKRMLKVLTPLLLQRLANATDDQKRGLAEILRNAVRRKNLMAYAKDRALEAYLENSGLGGELYMSSSPAAEDYLAVVNANIAGGKSDAFMEESIALESNIDIEGKVTNRLTVTRAHTGDTQDAWWYRAPNKNFIQLFTPSDTRLTGLSGNDDKTPDAPLVRPTYLRDPDVEAIERTGAWLPEYKALAYDQFGKKTFAAWLTVKAGQKKTLIADYELGSRVLLAAGVNYRFVFERQSGTKTRLQYTVDAPPGFIWKESNATSYAFQSGDPDGRIVLDLTLKKL